MSTYPSDPDRPGPARTRKARNRKKQMALVKRLGVCPRPPPGVKEERKAGGKRPEGESRTCGHGGLLRSSY